MNSQSTEYTWFEYSPLTECFLKSSEHICKAVSNIPGEWKIQFPVAMMRIDLSFGGLFAGVQNTFGIKQFGFTLQSKGR